MAHQPTRFKSPPVEEGMVVYWHPDPDAAPVPAIVTVAGTDTISVNIVHTDVSTFIIKTGCRHKDDPRNIRGDDRDAGFWSHTPFMKKMMIMMDVISKEMNPTPPTPPLKAA